MMALQDWPRMTIDLTGPRVPGLCQSCGAPGEGYREHDDYDRPQDVFLFLCGSCAKRLVEPHPRLYGQLSEHEPAPGAMPLCLDCRHRDGVDCTETKANGGPGLELIHPKPTDVHVCRSPRRLSGWMKLYTGPVKHCDRKELIDVGGR